MKKLLILAILMSAVALFATPPTWSYHVNPTLLSFSIYDYMNGAYNGYPVRIQNESVANHGVYFTYMANPSAAVPRKQRFAFATLDGVIEAEDNLTSQNASEGFGTLAIDPVSGNPFFAWHAGYGNSTFNVFFTYDIFSFTGTAGNAIGEYSIAVQNTTGETAHEYIWPVVHIGPSPVEGKRRVYVFATNSGNAVQGTASSSITMSFADFSQDDMETGAPSDIVWTQRRLPYFIDIHNWSPSNPDDNFARAFPSYGVSEDGKVALAGMISGNSTEWSGLEEHDTFVVINNNYGEGDFDVNGFYLQRNLPSGHVPTAMIDGEPEQLYNPSEYDNFRMIPATLNHKTITFDRNGKLQFPSVYRIFWYEAGLNPDEEDSGYTIHTMQSINNLLFDTVTEELEIYNIMPRPENPMSNEIPIPWDLNNDGYVDNYIINSQGQIEDWFPHVFPYFYYSGTDDFFHLNQVRLTQDNNGLMAMMWIDGNKSYQFNQNSDENYAEYATAPEIMISITKDSGRNWSEPIVMNVLTNPELGDIPSYVYPADKIIWVNDNTARLFFMYVDDKSYGAYTQNQGANLGAEIKFTAIDINLSNLVNTNDLTSIKPQSMLAQNYPNPFNPTTNIKFNISTAGKVNLNVYNVKGQLVKTLMDAYVSAGEHTVTWNGVDNSNNNVSSGVYFYKLENNGKVEMRKMVLMK